MANDEALRKIIRRYVEEALADEEQLEEKVTTQNVDPILTPFAFRSETDWDEDEEREKHDVFSLYAVRSTPVLRTEQQELKNRTPAEEQEDFYEELDGAIDGLLASIDKMEEN